VGGRRERHRSPRPAAATEAAGTSELTANVHAAEVREHAPEHLSSDDNLAMATEAGASTVADVGTARASGRT